LVSFLAVWRLANPFARDYTYGLPKLDTGEYPICGDRISGI